MIPGTRKQLRKAVLLAITRLNADGKPAVKSALKGDFPAEAELGAAIQYLWQNGYLARRIYQDELEYFVKRLDGVPVKLLPAGYSKGYWARWDREKL